MVMHLAVVGDDQVPFYGDAVHLDLVAGTDDDVVPAVGGFADALHSLAMGMLGLPQRGCVLANVLHERFGSRILGKFTSLHDDLHDSSWPLLKLNPAIVNPSNMSRSCCCARATCSPRC